MNTASTGYIEIVSEIEENNPREVLVKINAFLARIERQYTDVKVIGLSATSLSARVTVLACPKPQKEAA